MLKVVFHVNDRDKVDSGIGNIKNLQKSMDEPVDIIYLGNGNSVLTLLKREVELKKLKITVNLCNNSLKNFDIDSKSVSKVYTIVPAGVKALVEYQAQGYAYIKV